VYSTYFLPPAFLLSSTNGIVNAQGVKMQITFMAIGSRCDVLLDMGLKLFLMSLRFSQTLLAGFQGSLQDFLLVLVV
jgi:hypothetical protein